MDNDLSIAVIGFPKCATSSLAEVLGMQEWSNRPIEKELDILSRDLSRMDEYFLDNSPSLRKYDASPNIIIDIAKMERLKVLFPNLKVIVCIRHPHDRFISHIYHRLKMGEIRLKDLDKIFNGIIQGDSIDLYEYCRYDYYLRKALRIFGDNLKIIESENIDYTALSLFLDEEIIVENEISINERKEYSSYTLNRVIHKFGILLRIFGVDTRKGVWGNAKKIILRLNENNEPKIEIKIPKELEKKLELLAGNYQQFL